MKRNPSPAQTCLGIPFLLLGCAVSCAPAPPDEPLVIETEDVAPPLDDELSTEDDLQAVQRAAQISGLVPGDVSPDLPLFAPSSVVDFGGPAGGRAFVDLDTGEPVAVVRGWLGERLPGAGWTIGAIGDDLVEAHKGERRVAYRLTDLRPGTRIRLEYEPRP
jgi:hypothetical protein